MNARTITPGAATADAERERDGYGTLVEPTTLRIERVLPGPVERVWSYLTDGELRRQWLAAGAMETKVDSTFELVWRNDELTAPPGRKPEGFGTEHRMQSRVVECDAPRRLTFTWGEGTVTFELEPQGRRVLLTVTHTRLTERNSRLMVGAGWHAHLEILAARIGGEATEPFWDRWVALKQDYDARLPR